MEGGQLCYDCVIRFTFRLPSGNTRGPQYMDQALAAVHAAIPRDAAITLGFARHADQVILTADVPSAHWKGIVRQLLGHYPDGRVEEIEAKPGLFLTPHFSRLTVCSVVVQVSF